MNNNRPRHSTCEYRPAESAQKAKLVNRARVPSETAPVAHNVGTAHVRSCGAATRTTGISPAKAEEQEQQKFADRYCAPCQRTFMTPSNLHSHQRSHIHQGRRTPCPFPGCGKHFVSTAAVFLHLESGTCASGMTLSKLVRIVARVDRAGVFITPTPRADLTPSSSRSSSSASGVERGGGAWMVRDGSLYRCAACRRAFKSYVDFVKHAGSAAHAEERMRCPYRSGGCGARFRTLSGFCQHVEGAQCSVRYAGSDIDKVIRCVLREVKRSAVVQ